MLTPEQAIDELYHAKIVDNDSEEVEVDRSRFFQQLSEGFRNGVFDLSYCQAGMNVLARIPKFFRLFPHIKTFQFYSNLFRDNGLSKLHEILELCEQITSLDIGCNDLTDASLMTLIDILKHTNITSLQLGSRDKTLQQNRLTKESLISLINAIIPLNKIECFGISGIPIARHKKKSLTQEFPKYLSKLISSCPNLKTLDISYCGLSNNDQIDLSNGFRSNKSLRILNISHNNFPHRTKVFDGITTLDHLVSLNLSSCMISEHSCDVLSKKFTKGWNLIILNLSNNKIGTSGVSKLFKALSNNNTLVSLNLANTGIDYGLYKEFHLFMKNTQVLRDLDLSKNNISDSVATALADILPDQESLVNLNLATCRITDKGSFLLCEAISKNRVIKKLSLRNNFLTRENGYDIVELLQSNETLRLIDVSSNQIDLFANEAIEKLCKRNKQSSHDRNLQDIRKEYIKLSIQSAKIPSLKDKLGNLTETGRDLREKLIALEDKIEVFDSTTAANIEMTKKSIIEYQQFMQQEKKQIAELEVKMVELKDEENEFRASFEQKKNDEQEIITKLTNEAIDIENSTEQYQKEGDESINQLKEQIKLIESIMKEINEMKEDPDKLKYYEIPEYPFDDQFKQEIADSLKEQSFIDVETTSLGNVSVSTTKSKKKKGKAVVTKPFTRNKAKK